MRPDTVRSETKNSNMGAIDVTTSHNFAPEYLYIVQKLHNFSKSPL